MSDSKIKVAICDDHLLFRQGIKASLSYYDDIQIVAEAGDGSQLMQLLKHMTPDIILLDINMPIMDGIESLPKLKSEYPDIKVIIVSMHNNASMVSKMMALGANSYLTKGDTPELIYEAIKRVYNEEFYFTTLMNKSLLKSTQENDTLKKMDIKIVSELNSPKPKVSDTNTEILERIVQKLDEIDKRKEYISIPTVTQTNDKDPQINWWTLIARTMVILLMCGGIIFLIWAISKARSESAKSQSSKIEINKQKNVSNVEATNYGDITKVFETPYNLFGH